jgi:hypothetical protein
MAACFGAGAGGGGLGMVREIGGVMGVRCAILFLGGFAGAAAGTDVFASA